MRTSEFLSEQRWIAIGSAAEVVIPSANWRHLQKGAFADVVNLSENLQWNLNVQLDASINRRIDIACNKKPRVKQEGELRKKL